MSRLVLALVFVFFVARPLAADGGDYAARATLARERLVATHGEDPTAAGTALDVADRVAVPRSLGEVVQEAPGARVQNSGGLGAFSSLSLRGADGAETLVLLGEIPLMTPDGGAFDLSAFPAELFERIDVFRGGAPVWLGSGAIGGVVRLVPRRSCLPSYDAAAGAGSFGSWQLQAGATAPREPERPALHTRAIVRGAENDYPYTDDRGTRFDAADDVARRRRNAQLLDASGLVDLAVPVWGGRLHSIVLANGRIAGAPGPGSRPTPDVQRTRTRLLAATDYERSWGAARSPEARLQLLAAGSHAHDRYTDLFGELGQSRRWSTDDDAFRGYFRSAGTLRLARWLEGTLVSSYAIDRYDPEDAFTFPAPAPSTRHAVAAAIELAARGAIADMAFELRPSARIEWTRTELHANRGATGPFDSTRNLAAPTARVAAGFAPIPALALTASVATGVRLPTMFELFGDRGLVLPSPELQPVTSTTYDAGLTAKLAGRAFRGAVELRGFIQSRRDEIAMFRTTRAQVQHVNLSDVEQRGFELGLQSIVFDTFALHGAATYLRSEDALGKRLPMRPVWNVFARPELRLRFSSVAMSAGFGAELGYRSFAFADRANLAVIPECTTAALSASIGFLRDRVRLSGRIEDLANARCTDWVGYPLPGRSLFLTLTYQEYSRENA